MDRYTDKQRRSVRRRNRYAHDLRTPKYRQRVVDNKRPPPPPPEVDDYDDDDDYYNDNDKED